MLKCVMYFSEYILKYIISKVKKKKSLSPSPWIFLSHRCLEVLGTKVTGMVRAEHSGVRQKVKDPANTGGGGCTLLLPPGCCSDTADGSWHWRNVCGSSLHFLSHHPSNEEEHFLRLTGAQVRCFLVLPLEFRMQVFYSHAGAGVEWAGWKCSECSQFIHGGGGGASLFLLPPTQH